MAVVVLTFLVGFFLFVTVACLMSREARAFIEHILIALLHPFRRHNGSWSERPLSEWELGRAALADAELKDSPFRVTSYSKKYLMLGPVLAGPFEAPLVADFDVSMLRFQGCYLIADPDLTKEKLQERLAGRDPDSMQELIFIEGAPYGWYWEAAREEIARMKRMIQEEQAKSRQEQLKRKMRVLEESERLREAYYANSRSG